MTTDALQSNPRLEQTGAQPTRPGRISMGTTAQPHDVSVPE
jgi:hypothetical protein